MARRKGQAAVEERAAKLEQLEVTYMAVGAIKPNAYNPNRQAEKDFQLLLRSMQEDGFTTPVVVQRETHEIVDGEHRWRAAKELGMTEIPVVLVDMDEAQMRLSTLRHNRARGSEDVDLTAQLFRDLRELGSLDAAQDALGLDQKELERVLDDTPAAAALAGDEFSPAWEPTGRGYSREERVDRYGAGGLRLESASPAALEVLRVADDAAAAATNERERVAILKGRDVYRLSVVYKHDDGLIVSAVLGDSPAAKLVELCRARLATDA